LLSFSGGGEIEFITLLREVDVCFLFVSFLLNEVDVCSVETAIIR